MAAGDKPPKVTYSLPQATVKKTLDVMILVGRREVLQRAFPDTQRSGRDVRGGVFKPLSPKYRKRKQKQLNVIAADQRLSSKTANALVVTRQTEKSRHLGWLLNSEIASHLQRRNNFWPLSNDDEKKVIRFGRSTLQKGLLPAGLKVQKGVIRITAKISS